LPACKRKCHTRKNWGENEDEKRKKGRKAGMQVRKHQVKTKETEIPAGGGAGVLWHMQNFKVQRKSLILKYYTNLNLSVMQGSVNHKRFKISNHFMHLMGEE